MKYFVFADVHGFYSILKNELDNAGFDVNNEDHMLISIGDNFDRGPENYEMFLFLKEMKEKNKIILIKGNHEDLFMDMLRKGYPQSHDYTNRTYDTLLQFYRKYFNITDEEIVMLCDICKIFNVELVLQPKMIGNVPDVSSEFMLVILNKCLQIYHKARLIPQVHKFINVE